MKTIIAKLKLKNGDNVEINGVFPCRTGIPFAAGEIKFVKGKLPNGIHEDYTGEHDLGGQDFLKQIKFDAKNISAEIEIEESGDYEDLPDLPEGTRI